MENSLYYRLYTTSLKKSYDAFAFQFLRAREELSEAAVHDARVAIRRALSRIEFVAFYAPNEYLTELVPCLKRLLKSLSPLRDAQTQLLALQALKLKAPYLIYYERELKNNEKAFIEQAEAAFETFDLAECDRLMFFGRQAAKMAYYDRPLQADEPLERARQAFCLVLDCINKLDSNHIETYHRVRLVFKKYRYLVETLSAVLGSRKAKLKQMNSFQTALGNIQDNAVYVNGLIKFAEVCEGSSRRMLLASVNKALEKRQELANNFDAIATSVNELSPASIWGGMME